MEDKDVINMISTVRQINGMLGILDKYKEDSNITLKKLLQEFVQEYKINLNDYYFFNQHQFITSLLSYIVIPKETFYDEMPLVKISELNEKWGLTHNKCNNLPIKKFIRHLRNAIAHGNIDVNEKLEFTFNDSDKIIIYLNGSEILKFTQALAYWVISKDIELKDLN